MADDPYGSPTEEDLTLRRQRGLAAAARTGISPARVRAAYQTISPAALRSLGMTSPPVGVGAGRSPTPSPVRIVTDDEGPLRAELDRLYNTITST